MARGKYDYFAALEQQGKYASEVASVLVGALKNFEPETIPDTVVVAHAIENAADKQNHEILTHVETEFLTPIDREDIAKMAHDLDDTVDYIEDVIQQLYMYNVQAMYPPAVEMAEIVKKTADALVQALAAFRNFRKAQNFNEYVIAVNDLEEEADRLYYSSIRALFANYTDDPVFVMQWRFVFTSMERCIDSCERVSDLMNTIILKNS